MIIDVFKSKKDKKFWEGLAVYNEQIKQVCANYNFAIESIEEYDLPNKKVSYWYDPNHQKELLISHCYPAQSPIQRDLKFDLQLYFANYPSLYVINKLYDNKEINIEDQAGGMGRFAFYLSKLGFKNFHITENFTQLCEDMLVDMMKKGKINYRLNDSTFMPTVINLVGWTEMTINLEGVSGLAEPSFKPETELLCLYNNITLRKGIEKKLISKSGFVFLCKDVDDLTYFYCKTEKLKEFKEKLNENSLVI